MKLSSRKESFFDEELGHGVKLDHLCGEEFFEGDCVLFVVHLVGLFLSGVGPGVGGGGEPQPLPDLAYISFNPETLLYSCHWSTKNKAENS
ncbi:hypothetical protein ACFL0Q_03025 [Thermodesulfobacteriota bacterium]